MKPPVQVVEDSNDFEFAALQAAENYRKALFEEFGPFLKGQVLEIGSGIGQMSAGLLALPGIRRAVLVEPEPAYCTRLRAQFPGQEVVQGTSAALPPGTDWDAVLSVNVLEHIGEDQAELSTYARLLQKARGVLCLLVPARPEIYAPLDKDFGHFRRYTRPELKRKLLQAGFHIERLHYYNFVGYFAWWLNFRVMQKRVFEPWKVRSYDKLIFPTVHALESKVCRPPFGQSLLAIARSNSPA